MILIFFPSFKGDKIHAIIRKTLVNKYQDKFVDGGCYKICYLTMVPNLGSYRTTKHDSKLVFQFRTIVQSCDIPSIPLYSVYATPLHEILHNSQDCDYLIGEYFIGNCLFFFLIYYFIIWVLLTWLLFLSFFIELDVVGLLTRMA